MRPRPGQGDAEVTFGPDAYTGAAARLNLARLRGHLVTLAAADPADAYAALDLAVTLWVWCHTTAHTTSLLEQLNLVEQLRCPDSTDLVGTPAFRGVEPVLGAAAFRPE